MPEQMNTPSATQPSSVSQHSNTEEAQISAMGRNNDPAAQTGGTSAPNSAAAESATDRPLAAIISERFPPFDAQALIVTPFDEETANDAKLDEELSNMLLSTLLKTHAWMASRPKYEAELTSRQLESDISRIIERERQQGMSSSRPLPTLPSLQSPTPSIVSVSSSVRRRGLVEETREKLGEFVQRMKTALSALLGGTSFSE